MHSSTLRIALVIFVTIVAAAGLTACGSNSSWLDGPWTGDDERTAEPVTPGAPNADDYLRELDELATGDPATQVEIYADAESAARLTPGPSTNLRLALALATPGHSETDLERAQSLLRELMTQAPLMTPSETALTHIYLNSVEERLVAEAEARRLRQSAPPRVDRTEEQALSQRLAAIEAENRRLRTQLAEAEEKLEAITSIERSIREQSQ